jgi:hypothetical protein
MGCLLVIDLTDPGTQPISELADVMHGPVGQLALASVTILIVDDPKSFPDGISDEVHGSTIPMSWYRQLI